MATSALEMFLDEKPLKFNFSKDFLSFDLSKLD